jgi:4-hydroxy-tetrahydrodipicolinate reductase
MIRIVINGILGRMGSEVCRRITEHEDLVLLGGVDTLETYLGDTFVISKSAGDILDEADLVIDFSSGEGTSAIAQACSDNKVALITGTTGLTAKQQEAVNLLSRTVPVLQCSNFSIGLNLLISLTHQTARQLGGHFDAEIVDIHHREHRESPSASAQEIANLLIEAIGNGKSGIHHGRGGNGRVRGDEVTIHSLRGGSVVGEHQIHFFGEDETLSLTHKVTSRKVYVDGVMRAIRWLSQQDTGYYTMKDMLGV